MLGTALWMECSTMWASARSIFVLALLSAAKSKCDVAHLFVIHPSTHIPFPCFQ